MESDKINTKGKELYQSILDAEIKSEQEYLRLSKKVSDKKVSKMFEQMAKEERNHHDRVAKQFLDALYNMEDWILPEDIDLPKFKEAPDTKSVKKDIEYKKALELALEGEKRAYAVYSAALEKTSDAATKKMLKNIAADEKKHYEFLVSEFEK